MYSITRWLIPRYLFVKINSDTLTYYPICKKISVQSSRYIGDFIITSFLFLTSIKFFLYINYLFYFRYFIVLKLN